ncbi:MAG TPA: hypothetical protein VMU93_04205 [Caulobacteraceae bacterium]|nr:hypothetical protein [Caulobacteraceae bacterium]
MDLRFGWMVGIAAAIGVAAASVALARPPAPASAPVVEAVARCRQVPADAARLAC